MTANYMLMILGAFLFVAPAATILALRGMSLFKATLVAFVLALLSLMLSLDDVHGFQAPAECHGLAYVENIRQDPDGNRVYEIVASDFARWNPTDLVCEAFGRCVLALITHTPGMGAVEIVNPPDEWVPSKWRNIEVWRAMVLAGVIDLETYNEAMAFQPREDD